MKTNNHGEIVQRQVPDRGEAILCGRCQARSHPPHFTDCADCRNNPAPVFVVPTRFADVGVAMPHTEAALGIDTSRKRIVMIDRGKTKGYSLGDSKTRIAMRALRQHRNPDKTQEWDWLRKHNKNRY